MTLKFKSGLPATGFSALLLLLLLSFSASAQTPTTPTTKDPGATTTADPAATTNGKPKVLFVPFNVKMYMSEIDMSINKETGMNYRQIRDGFRSGIVNSMMDEFRKTCTVMSLLDDTAKMKKDLAYVYEVTSLSYDPVNSTAKTTSTATVTTTTDKKAAPKTPTGVQKGQIAVATDDQEKFMNTVIMSPNLLEYLKKKYKCDYVVFVNELDLKNELGEDPYNTAGAQEFKRSATVHYTIVATSTSKRVASGKAKALFTNKQNKPQKIIDGTFKAVAKIIFDKFELGRK
jgi:hypothetical protein